MKTIDTFLAWLLVALGAAHILLGVIPLLHWIRFELLIGGGLTITALGFLNVARTRNRGDCVLRWSCFACNLVALFFAARVLLQGNRHLPSFTIAVLLLCLTILAVRK